MQVSNYCSGRLHHALTEELKVFEKENFKGTMQDQWEKVFTNCFQMVDDEVGGRIAKNVGSTAVVALICSSHIIVANCGDSRGVLYRGKEAVPLSNDHKPSREDERRRIEAAGGTIIQYYGQRVCGVLSMSRSIGEQTMQNLKTGHIVNI
ncbi:putative protein-serine/threonine phosphatase [Helianthus annuus]|uniref:PPM-type phosphatase domain-containing protein n=1 Tax=Helianthus annuus TaxID=4232 RepID=A0A9K3J3Z1_HELAN|nr:protein phosphatase 2C 50 [Helianthus annuus]KAF5807931.1 putative protein-serine/threonine phosphatase [Helianthus annuus]KAJ0595133.1 putative protein-serine/threonine phosphatase [Helianthus annuus]KAJ0755818.1 putative protein-serine/threonine phosphatase [Helianthus annuus]KAJ0924674.1 putative protein-serine/threonine phosphatase [Helianthus annuus]